MTRLLILAAVAAVATPGEARPRIDERGFEVGTFEVIQLTSSDAVRVMPGPEISVTARGDAQALASLAMHVDAGTLHIGRTSGRDFGKSTIITVTLPVLRAASLSGSGRLDVTGPVAAQSFAAQVSGSGSFSLSKLQVREARLDVSGSGSISAQGTAEQLSIKLHGSGDVDARSLMTPVLAVSLGGSGEVRAAASRSAEISAGGSGGVKVSGHPTCNIRRSGPVRVTCN